MESQPRNPEFRLILKTFTHAYLHIKCIKWDNSTRDIPVSQTFFFLK